MSKLIHDINGSLLTIRLQADNIEKAMPELIKGYLQACSHHLIEAPLSERVLSNLQATVNGVVEEVEKLKILVRDITSE